MPSDASTCSSPFSRSSATRLRTIPWCLPRISSARCKPERRLSVPESAWLTSRSVERRRDSRASTAPGSAAAAARLLAMLPGAGADGLLLDNGHGTEERHQVAQPGADLLDLVRALLAAPLVEPLAARLVLRDPSARVLPAPDLLEHPLHFGLRLGGHDARPARVVAVFRRVAHRVPHVVQPALINQVDDQLELVEALEVRDLRLVAGLDQRLE